MSDEKVVLTNDVDPYSENQKENRRYGSLITGRATVYGHDSTGKTTTDNTSTSTSYSTFYFDPSNFKNNQVKLYAFGTQYNDSLPRFFNRIYDPDWWQSIFNDWSTELGDGILFIRAYPFSFYSDDGVAYPSCGVYGENPGIRILGKNVNDTEESFIGLDINESTHVLDFGTITFTSKFNDFRDYEPYTSIKLYLPFYGTVELDVEEVMNQTIQITYVNDLYDGDTTIYVDIVDDPSVTVANGSTSINENKRTIFTTTTTIYQDISTFGTNQAEKIQAQRDATLNGILSVITLGASASISTIGPLGAVGGALTATRGVSKMLSPNGGVMGNVLESAKSKRNNGTPPVGNGGWSGPTLCYAIIDRKQAINYPDMKDLIGLPNGETYTLSDLTGGYVSMSTIYLEDIYTEIDNTKYYATDNELSELESLLKQGVFIYD